MKKSFLKVIAIILTVALLGTAMSLTGFAVDDTADIRKDLAQTLNDFVAFLGTFKASDFLGMFSSILKGLGFTTEFTGFQDFAKLADEFFGMLGGTAGIYETIINAINANQLLDFLSTLLAGK